MILKLIQELRETKFNYLHSSYKVPDRAVSLLLRVFLKHNDMTPCEMLSICLKIGYVSMDTVIEISEVSLILIIYKYTYWPNSNR